MNDSASMDLGDKDNSRVENIPKQFHKTPLPKAPKMKKQI